MRLTLLALRVGRLCSAVAALTLCLGLSACGTDDSSTGGSPEEEATPAETETPTGTEPGAETPETSTPGTETPGPTPSTPGPGTTTPGTPNPGSPDPETGTPTPDPENPTPDPENPTPDPENPTPDTGTPVSGPMPTFTRVTLFDNLPGAAWLTPTDLDEDGFDELLLTTLSEGIDFTSMPPLGNGGAWVLSRDGGPPTDGSGHGTWTAERAFDPSAGIGFPNRSTVMDVDNDGVDDWVVAAGFVAKPTGKIVWMKGSVQQGTLSFAGAPREIPVRDPERWYHEVMPVDLDNDGDLDFVTTNNNTRTQLLGGLALGTSQVEWFENQGVAGQALFEAHTIAEAGGSLFDMHDLDADGDEDILLPQFFGGASLVWLENPGNPKDAWTEHLIDDSTGRGFIAEVVDLEGDGDLEIVYGDHDHQAAAAPDEKIMGIYWWDLPAPGEIHGLADWSATKHVLHEGFHVTQSDPNQYGAPGVLRLGDIDQDGDLDVSVSGDGDEGLYLFVQHAPETFEMMTIDTGHESSGDHVMMDLDGDGDMDYVWAVFGPAGMSIQSYVYAFLQGPPVMPPDPDTDGEGEGSDPSDTPAGDTPFEQGPHTWTRVPTTLNSLASAPFPSTFDVVSFIPDTPGAHPVLIFHDGFNLSGELYHSYGEHLASWGFVAVIADMPATMLEQRTHIGLSDRMIEVMDWVELLGADPNGPLAGRADSTRMALAGHSLGGKIAILTATRDPRPIAIYTLDAVDSLPPFSFANPADNPSVTPELMDQVSVPLVLVGETTNSEGFTPCAPAAENFEQYFNAATGPTLMIEVLGASHMSFLDNPNCGLTCSACPAGTDDPAETLTLARGLMVAFLKGELEEDTSFDTYLVGDAMQQKIAAGIVTMQAKNGF